SGRRVERRSEGRAPSRSRTPLRASPSEAAGGAGIRAGLPPHVPAPLCLLVGGRTPVPDANAVSVEHGVGGDGVENFEAQCRRAVPAAVDRLAIELNAV